MGNRKQRRLAFITALAVLLSSAAGVWGLSAPPVLAASAVNAYGGDSVVYPSMATARTGFRTATGSEDTKGLYVDTTTSLKVGGSASYSNLDFGARGLREIKVTYTGLNTKDTIVDFYLGTSAAGQKIAELTLPKGDGWKNLKSASVTLSGSVSVTGVQSIYMKVRNLATYEGNNTYNNIFDFRGLDFTEQEEVLEISGFSPIADKEHIIGTSGFALPAQAEAIYTNETKGPVDVRWNSSDYDLMREGDYTVTGTVAGTDKKPSFRLHVREPLGGSYRVSGVFTPSSGSVAEGTYTATVALRGMKAVAGTFGLRYDASIMKLKNDGIGYLNGAKTAGVPLPTGSGYRLAGWIAAEQQGQHSIDATVAPIDILTFSFDMTKEDYEMKLNRDSLGVYQYDGNDTSIWDSGGYVIDSGTAYAYAADNAVSYPYDDRFTTVIHTEPGAEVTINGYTLTAEADGTLQIALADGKTAYKVSKEGFRSTEGTLTADGGKPLTIPLVEEGRYTVTKNVIGGTVDGADSADLKEDYVFTVTPDTEGLESIVVIRIGGSVANAVKNGNRYTIKAADITGDIEIDVSFKAVISAYSKSDIYPSMADATTGFRAAVGSESTKGLYVNTTTALTEGGSALYKNLNFGSKGLKDIQIVYSGLNTKDTIVDFYLGTDASGEKIAEMTVPKGNGWKNEKTASAEVTEGVSVTGVQSIYMKIRGLGTFEGNDTYNNIFDFRGLAFTERQNAQLIAISSATVSLAAPSAGAAPTQAGAVSDQYRVTSTVWKTGGNLFEGNFGYSTVYTASITLTAETGYTFDDSTAVRGVTPANKQVNGSGEGNTLSFDVEFSATEEEPGPDKELENARIAANDALAALSGYQTAEAVADESERRKAEALVAEAERKVEAFIQLGGRAEALVNYTFLQGAKDALASKPDPGTFTVKGMLSLTAGDVTKAEVILTRRRIDSASAAYEFAADAADYRVGVKADKTYELRDVEPGAYTVLVRKPGALFYRKAEVLVNSDLILDEVRLPVGDLNFDGFIDGADNMVLLGGANYNKSVFDAGVLQEADLNNDGFIDGADIMVLLGGSNFNTRAVIE